MSLYKSNFVFQVDSFFFYYLALTYSMRLNRSTGGPVLHENVLRWCMQNFFQASGFWPGSGPYTSPSGEVLQVGSRTMWGKAHRFQSNSNLNPDVTLPTRLPADACNLRRASRRVPHVERRARDEPFSKLVSVTRFLSYDCALPPQIYYHHTRNPGKQNHLLSLSLSSFLSLVCNFKLHFPILPLPSPMLLFSTLLLLLLLSSPIFWAMVVPDMHEVLDFLRRNGFVEAESALRDDILQRGGGLAPPPPPSSTTAVESPPPSPAPPPPVRIVVGGGPRRQEISAGDDDSSSGSDSSSAFVSMGSSPSGDLYSFGAFLDSIFDV